MTASPPPHPDRPSGAARGAAGAATVVVDLGGVVLTWDPAWLVRSYLGASDDADAARLVEVLFQDFALGGDWSEFDRGTLGVDDLVARMAARSGVDAAALRAMIDGIPEHLLPFEDTLALLRRLRASGVRVVYLSNMPAPLADLLDRDPAFASEFDGGVFSCRVGLVKPEPAIFAEAARRLGLSGRVLLLDDRQPNLDAAAAAGWEGILFTGAAQAEQDLVAAGCFPGGS